MIIRYSCDKDESLDGTPNGVRVLQLKRGQRLASDDIILAGLAAQHAKGRHRFLDLGTGKGAVALMLMHAAEHLKGVGIEAYPRSFQLAVRNRSLNNMEARWTVVLGDNRRSQHILGDQKYELITGAPPFIQLGHGVSPKNEQRLFGRMEMRGGVEDYLAAVSRHLCPGNGLCFILMDAHNEQRTHEAFRASGLHVHSIYDIFPYPDGNQIYQVFVGSYIDGPVQTYRLYMRTEKGAEWSPSYSQIRNRLGLP